MMTDPSERRDRGADGVPLAMDGETFRRAGYALVDRIAGLLTTLPERPVTRGASPQQIRDGIDGTSGLPQEGADAEAILADAADYLIEHSLYNGHPRFFGYISGSPAPIGMLGDMLAAAINPNVGAWKLSPVASEIEAQTVRWIAELLGYPTDCGGLLVSGGNMANFVGFLAARAAVGADWEIRRRGLRAEDASPLTVYVSTETHTWVQKATDLFGLGTDAVRWIPVDGRLRMDLDALASRIAEDRAAGYRPMLVVGTGGSVMTGAVDPLPALVELCRAEGIWLHVDGAYGAFAAASPEAPDDLRALALADSVAVDPHKWLYAPLEAGCVLVRRPEALRETFAYHPPYYSFDTEAVNYVDWGPQNSRGFRALKVWLALRQAGRDGYTRMITQDILLARRLQRAAERHPELEFIAGGLSIAAFRYVPPDLRSQIGTEAAEAYLNELNEAIQGRMEVGGEAFVSNAIVGGRYALRACIVNFNTTAADIDTLPELVVRLGREEHVARRSVVGA